jgi:hypothetical protein
MFIIINLFFVENERDYSRYTRELRDGADTYPLTLMFSISRWACFLGQEISFALTVADVKKTFRRLKFNDLIHELCL